MSVNNLFCIAVSIALVKKVVNIEEQVSSDKKSQNYFMNFVHSLSISKIFLCTPL